MKNVLISLQLLVFMLIGVVGLLAFGTIISDKFTDGKINYEIEFVTEYTESHNEQYLADKILTMAENNNIHEVIDFCEKYDMKIAIYVGHSRPIYSNMIINNMTLQEEKTANHYYGEKYSLYLISNNVVIEKQPFFYSISPAWKYLYARIWIAFLGVIASLAILAASILLMAKYGTAVNKIWVYLSAVAVGEISILIHFGLFENKFLIVCILLEKIVVGVIAYCILARLGKVYSKVQRMAYEGLNDSAIGTDSEQKDITIKPFSLNDFENDMDSVSEYVSDAVKSKLKSERLRTELITNVSHDLKTPLTSVINFSDLINKEAEPDTTIAEYADHLHKQSIKLKELLDALLDASKAASGALEVNMEACDVHTLLEQCVVEYEDRLAKAGVELIEKYPDDDVKILADVRFLHRIFENVLINICKYSMPGTRAYIDAAVVNGKVSISFKNISKEPLDISAEELTERFVRGDKSRHTEGHGLGLSVVRSLMELQNAKTDIVVNGDLFVISLVFKM